MNAVPNTEDLRYMLSECTLQRKPVILPFKNPASGLGFVIKVSPAVGEGGPRWTFERWNGNMASLMWTRESREVAMIQGKLAIDTIYTGAAANLSNARNAEPPENTSMAEHPRHSGSFPAPKTPTAELAPVTPPFGFIEPPNYNQKNSPDWFCSFNTIPPETTALPPPAQFDAKLLTEVVASLTDPQTYLATYGAFTYFLLRQYAQYQMTQSGFAVVVFQVTIKQNDEEMMIPQESFRSIAERIRTLMSPLDVAAHTGDGEFAVLLCSSDSADALRFARSLYETLSGQSLLPEGISAEQSVVVGAASLPETCRDPGELLAAAREAKEVALCSSRPYLLYP